MSTQLASLGGGCFWCLEAVFEEVVGVEKSVSGYAGGRYPNPTYSQVCTGTTDHAEVVQLSFDPEKISYRQLLEIFFAIHDPTTLNRQGADEGTQYRSVIYTHSPEQDATARDVVREWTDAKVYDQPIVTQIEPAPTFFPAEEYHQGYFRNHPGQGYCQVVISPKVAKFRKAFESLRKS